MRFAVLTLIALVGTAAEAGDWAPRTNLEVVALDGKTGAQVWSYKGPPLGPAHFAMYPGVLAVYPHYDLADTSNPSLLDPKTGRPLTQRRHPKRRLAKSSGQWNPGPVSLANGWRLKGFRSGYTKDVVFADKAGKVAWRIHFNEYPEVVVAHKDTALVAYGSLTGQAIVFAYKAGANQPAWSIDFNELLKKPLSDGTERLGRVTLQVIGEVLYAQTGEHVFALTPGTGEVLWRLDAAEALGLRYRPDLYGGALDVAVFAREGDMLVVSFENRVLGVSAGTGKVAWSLDPDTFPHTAFPLAYDGLVYITAGPRRGAAAAKSQ